MKNNKLTFLIIILLIHLGCTDEFLKEEHPTQQTVDDFFTEPGQADEAAISLYDNLANEYGDFLNGYLATFDMLRGDNLTLPKNFADNAIIKWLTLNYNAEDETVRDAWSNSYTRIYRANWLIDNVEDNPNIPAEEANRALAEAYFFRGFSYFNLVRYFMSAPLMLERTTSDNYYPENATEEELWAQVFSDYQTSLDLGGLPDPTPNFMDGRINTGVVHAMMARAYLYRTRPGSNQYWDQVKEHTQAVENLNAYGLEAMEDFQSLFVYTDEDKWVNNSEVIWGAGFIYGPIHQGMPFRYRNRSFIAMATMPVGHSAMVLENENDVPYIAANAFVEGLSRYALSEDLSDIMIDYHNQGDQRASEFLYYPSFGSYGLSNPDDFTSVVLLENVNSDSLYQVAKSTDGAQGEYIHIRKFQLREFIGNNIWDGGFNHSLVYPIVRYADILLMRAEAEFHLGNEQVAKDYLKQVTDRAGFDESYTNPFSGQTLLDEILQQRRVELMFESLRVPDLIRLDQFAPPNVGIYPGSVTFEEKLKVLPIPRRELDLNNNLNQNDMWR